MVALENSDRKDAFPLHGEYKGIKYRIDGDAVIVTASNGREVTIAPSAHSWPEQFDWIKGRIASGEHAVPVPSQPMRPSTFIHDVTSKNMELSAHKPEELWGIDSNELDRLWNAAIEIFRLHVR